MMSSNQIVRITICILLFAVFIAAASCDNKSNNYGTATIYDTVNNVEGLTLDIKENTVSESGLTIIIKNETQDEYTFGSSYCVEKQIDGKWYEVPHIIENAGWNAVGYSVGENGIREMELEKRWEWLYGKLSPGNYRIIKDCIYSRSPGDYDEYYIAANFTLE